MENRTVDKLVENRDEVRYSLSGKLPVNFHYGPQHLSFEALFVDISHRGLGLLVFEQHFSVGDELLMKSEAGQTYHLRVIWLKKTKMKGTATELIRVGLHCIDPGIDLLKEFADSSLIDM